MKSHDKFQIISTIGMLIGGYGIVIMIALSNPNNLGYSTYYTGLILVFIVNYTLVRARAKYAIFACWAIFFGYEYVAIFLQDLLTSPQGIILFVNNNFFFIASNIAGTIASIYVEYIAKKSFLDKKTSQIRSITKEGLEVKMKIISKIVKVHRSQLLKKK